MSLIQLVYSILIGLVQGISEWLPISSKTQVLIASTYLLNLTFDEAYTFGLFMEIGTIFAAIIYFEPELLILIRVLLLKGTDAEKKLFFYVFISTLITGIIGVPLYHIADRITGITVGIPMLVIGIILIADAILIRYSKKKYNQDKLRKKFEDLTIKDYLIIGAAQGIAALPGVSRSGITTSTMLIMDIEPREAFRLSFLIGIFASIAAFGLTLVVSYSNVSVALASIGILGLIIAILTATIVSLFLIDFLINVASKSQIVYLTSGLGIIAIGFGLLYIIFQV